MLYQNQNRTTPTQQTTKTTKVDETANWKTHRDLVYGMDIILDGKPAIKIPSSNSNKIWVINDKKYKFGIAFDQRDVSEANAELFDQILSTFKFTN